MIVTGQKTCTFNYTIPTPLACATTSCGWNGYDFTSLSHSDIQGSDGGQLYTYYTRPCSVLQGPPQCASLSPIVSACQDDISAHYAASDTGNRGQPIWNYINPAQPNLGV